MGRHQDELALAYLRPRVIIEIQGEQRFTPFNLIPVGLAEIAPRLMLLGSVPLQALSEISSVRRWWPASMRLEFWSPAEELTPDPSPAGMIFWATSTAGVTAATSLATSQGDPLIMIVKDPELASDLSMEGDGGTVVTLPASSFEDLSHLPRRLWQALLETWTRCLPLKSLGALPFVNLLSDRERSTFRMSEWIDAAGRGYASPAVMPTPATSVSADLIVRINQLILAGLEEPGARL